MNHTTELEHKNTEVEKTSQQSSLPAPSKDYTAMSDDELIQEWGKTKPHHKADRYHIYEECKKRNIVVRLYSEKEQKKWKLDADEVLIYFYRTPLSKFLSLIVWISLSAYIFFLFYAKLHNDISIRGILLISLNMSSLLGFAILFLFSSYVKLTNKNLRTNIVILEYPILQSLSLAWGYFFFISNIKKAVFDKNITDSINISIILIIFFLLFLFFASRKDINIISHRKFQKSNDEKYFSSRNSLISFPLKFYIRGYRTVYLIFEYFKLSTGNFATCVAIFDRLKKETKEDA